VYNELDHQVKLVAESSQAQKVKYPTAEGLEEAKRTLQLIGEHNLINASGAREVVKIVERLQPIPNSTDCSEVDFSGFTGLEHRLKFVKTVDRISYYDDSIATTPSSAYVALCSFSEPKVLILGGKDKGANYEGLGCELKNLNVERVYLIGENRKKIFDQISPYYGPISCLESKDMHEIIEHIHSEIVEHSLSRDQQNFSSVDKVSKVVILSPAASSFDMFKSYIDRGEQFIAAVESLSN
jgi:UDP-N-acetylmuramoylalanine--D-glutamate ligase